LIENLRMLKMKGFQIPTKFQNSKNALLFIPVLGFYKSAPAPNVLQGSFIGQEGDPIISNMFLPPDQLDPNAIDGVNANGAVCDLNATPTVNEFISEWNDRISILKTYSATVGYLSGSSNGCMLPYTRFCQYQTVSRDLTKVSKILRRALDPSHIKRVPLMRSSSKQGLTKFSEDKTTESFKEMFIPPNGTLNTQFTTAISSLGTITEEAKNIVNYFVLPTIVLEPGNVPTQQQVRIASFENNVFDVPVSADSLASRASQLINIGASFAPGVAASDNDEVSAIIKMMNTTGKGGFFGAVLGALGPILPF